MQLSLDKDLQRYVIHAYDETSISLIQPVHLVTEPGQRLVRVEHSLLLTGQEHQSWEPLCLDEIREKHMEAVLAYEPEVVLLGCGKRMRYPPAEILAPLHRRGIGVDVMNTAAACRTFNILVSEGRDLVALILPPSA